MTLIQPILIVLLVAGAGLSLLSLRSHLMTRVFAVALTAIGTLFIVHPDITNVIAHHVGVQRGADLIFYFLFIGSLYAFLILYVRQRSLQEKLIQLARSIAINSARVPNAPSPNQNFTEPQ